jgi:hypothetical protein
MDGTYRSTVPAASADRHTERSLLRQMRHRRHTFTFTAVHPKEEHQMVTRKSLGLLTALAVVLLAVSGLIGKHHHGAVRAIAVTAWWGFVLCALALIVASVAALVHHRANRN